jgi:hypothetical protein
MAGREMRWDQPHVDPTTRRRWRPTPTVLAPQAAGKGTCSRCHGALTLGINTSARGSRDGCTSHVQTFPRTLKETRFRGSFAPCVSNVRSVTGTCRCT